MGSVRLASATCGRHLPPDDVLLLFRSFTDKEKNSKLQCYYSQQAITADDTERTSPTGLL